MRRIIRDSRSYPLKFYVGLPAVSPPFPALEEEDFYPLRDLHGLLEDERALAISEITPFVRLVRGDRRLLSKITLARNAGKRVEGHTVGASYDKLNAIIDGGVTSCHESIKYGIEPVEGIRMATLNPATYFGLDWDLGGIAPSRFADLSIVEDLRRPTPRLVMERGRIVATEGELTVDPSPLPAIGLGDRPFTMGKVDQNLFRVPSQRRDRVTVPVIHIVDKTVTERRDVELMVREGAISADSARDVLKIVLIQRDGKRRGCGFLSFKSKEVLSWSMGSG